MKYVIVAYLLLSLVGCGLQPEEVIIVEDVCKDHGGWHNARVGIFDTGLLIECKDGLKASIEYSRGGSK